jgi:hypothetical protein
MMCAQCTVTRFLPFCIYSTLDYSLLIQILGELRLEEFACSAPNTSSLTLLTLRFSDSLSAIFWYDIIVQRTSNRSSNSVTPLVARNHLINIANSMQVDMDILSGTHQHARELPAELRAETMWILGLENLLTDSLGSCSESSFEEISWGSPQAGLLVVRPLLPYERNSNHTASEETKSGGLVGGITTSVEGGNWTTCWVNIDRISRKVAFHNHGPGTRAVSVTSCMDATLYLPSLTVNCPLELHILGMRSMGALLSSSDVAFKFQNVLDLWRWSRAFAAVCKNFSSGKGEVISFIPSRTAQHESEDMQVAIYCARVALKVLSVCAERTMKLSSLRTLQISGLQLRSARFVQAGDRVVLLLKGNNQHLTEGSVLVSVNGLSVGTVSPKVLLKFLCDFPDHMTAQIDFWRFPRSEYRVHCLVISRGDKGNDESVTGSNGTSITSSTNIHSSMDGPVGNNVIEKFQMMFDMSVASSSGSVSSGPNKLEQVIMRKRLSILHSPADVAGVGPAAAVNVATIMQQQTGIDTLASSSSNLKISDQDFAREKSNSMPWADCRMVIAGGSVAFLPIKFSEMDDMAVISRLQLASCEVNLSPANGSDDLLLEIKDRSNIVVVRCPNCEALMCLVESLMIAIKLLNPHFGQLSTLYDEAHTHQVFRVKRNSTNHYQTDSNNFGNGDTLISQHELYLAHKLESTAPTPLDTENDTSLLRAAEALELCLSGLRLPLVFPSAALVQQHVSDICVANTLNHRLMSEFLTIQHCVLHPLSSASDLYSPPQKTVTVSGNNRGEDEAIVDEELLTDSETPLVLISESDSQQHQSSGGGNRRTSTRMSLLGDSSVLSSTPSTTPFTGSSTPMNKLQVRNRVSTSFFR